MKKQFAAPWLAAILLAWIVPLHAQVLPFEVLGLKDGIPQSQVTALAQDREGYLWIGTWGGLARFNGNEFRNFFIEDGLHSTRIHELLVAGDGCLWIATVGGISRWQGHTLKKIDDPAVSGVRCRALAEDGRGRIWIGTDRGIVVFEKKTFRPLHPGGAAGPLVYDIQSDREGIVVVADNGLWRFAADGRTQEFSAMPMSAPKQIEASEFRAAAVTAEGLWLGTNRDGLWLGDDSGWRRTSAAIAPRSIYALTVEPSGTLYVSTLDNGIFLKRPGNTLLEHWGTENGLPSSLTSVVIEDRESNTWVGTDIGGLARLSNTAMINHTRAQGLVSDCVFGISPGDSPDSLWLGTTQGAIHYQVRPRPRVIETLDTRNGLDNQWVWKVLRTPDGTSWILTYSALYVRRKGEKAIQPLPATVPFPRTNPYDIIIDGKGNLWGCGEWSGGGLAQRDEKGVWRVWKETARGEPLTAVHHLASRRRGGVYAIARSDFFICDGKAVVPLETRSRCPLEASVNITAVMEDNSGRLWAGNDAGLAVLDTEGRWRLLNDRPGFANHHVFHIGEDWSGKVWVCTARGVFRFSGDYQVEQFNPDDGLASWETNAYGFFNDKRGDIWIGTINGLSQYSPAGAMPNTKPPCLRVESVRLPKRWLDFPERLDLAWNERTINVNVAILSFRSRNRIAFRARMEGLENEWLPLRRAGELRYTNLPAGDLKLLLQPINESGVWGETVALPIHVRPPVWMTLGFRLAAIFVLLTAFLGVYRWRTLLLMRRNRELEKEVSKRTAELEYLATYDPLTALFNRRAILAFLERELQPEKGSNRQLGCIMIDLNRFKQVNDTLGHAAGDLVLKEMAKKFKECLRQGDTIGRLGGDEFLVVLPGADSEALQAVYRRITEQNCQAGGGKEAISVSASGGGVYVPAGSSAAPAAILAKADDLLYQIKRSGRSGMAIESFGT